MKNGKKFHSTRVLAKDCSQQYTKADFDDNTSSDVIDDLDDVRCELFTSFPFHHRSVSVYLPDCVSAVWTNYASPVCLIVCPSV